MENENTQDTNETIIDKAIDVAGDVVDSVVDTVTGNDNAGDVAEEIVEAAFKFKAAHKTGWRGRCLNLAKFF